MLIGNDRDRVSVAMVSRVERDSIEGVRYLERRQCRNEVSASRAAVPSETIDWLATQITRYGLTKRQAWALLTAAPPEGGRYATEEWARQLGFQYQVILSYLWMWQNCQARFCLALP